MSQFLNQTQNQNRGNFKTFFINDNNRAIESNYNSKSFLHHKHNLLEGNSTQQNFQIKNHKFGDKQNNDSNHYSTYHITPNTQYYKTPPNNYNASNYIPGPFGGKNSFNTPKNEPILPKNIWTNSNSTNNNSNSQISIQPLNPNKINNPIEIFQNNKQQGIQSNKMIGEKQDSVINSGKNIFLQHKTQNSNKFTSQNLTNKPDMDIDLSDRLKNDDDLDIQFAFESKRNNISNNQSLFNKKVNIFEQKSDKSNIHFNPLNIFGQNTKHVNPMNNDDDVDMDVGEESNHNQGVNNKKDYRENEKNNVNLQGNLMNEKEEKEMSFAEEFRKIYNLFSIFE